MPDIAALAIVAATFFLAGAVKGVIGLGLPAISLAVLTVTIGLPQAMALMLVPSLVTNAWQAMTGGHGRVLARRLWPFLVPATAAVGLGALALTRVDTALLSALLGGLLVAYASVGLAQPRLSLPSGHEAWLGPVAGTVNGMLGGMTGSFVVPGILYLQAIGLPREMLVQAMGILFTASTVALALALGGTGLLTAELGVVSAAAVIPALLGMAAGRRVRRRLSEAAFRRLFFLSLIALGAWIVARL